MHVREYRNHNPMAELGQLLRRAALAVALVAVPVAAVAQSNSDPAPVVAGPMLLGGQLAKPNGVGFVLAVGLQRARG